MPVGDLRALPAPLANSACGVDHPAGSDSGLGRTADAGAGVAGHGIAVTARSSLVMPANNL